MAPRQSLLPSFLYAPSAGGNGRRDGAPAIMAGAPSEPPFGKIEVFSPAYYSACAFSGAAACGVTHAAVTPLDVIKCNIQVRAAWRGMSLSMMVGALTKSLLRLFAQPVPLLLLHSWQVSFY
jgi:solute carrier family 25 (mitochondrial phosphate transporter), member 3